jgi:hypothetical protein
MSLSARDDRAHVPDASPDWAETWGFELASDALQGFVRLTRVPARGVCWCWASFREVALGLIALRDDEVPLPRRADSLEVRGDGLWLELVCETPFEHWTIGLEAFGLRVDSLADEVGERLPVGLDLEWETDGSSPRMHGDRHYVQTGTIHGEVLIASDRLSFEGPGSRDHSWGAINLPVWPD